MTRLVFGVALSVALFTGGVAAAGNPYIQHYIPWRSILQPQETDWQALDVEFTYDAASHQYTDATVSWEFGSAGSGAIYVYLYDASGNTIADGSVLVSPAGPGTQDKALSLTWVAGKTLDDYNEGAVVIVLSNLDAKVLMMLIYG